MQPVPVQRMHYARAGSPCVDLSFLIEPGCHTTGTLWQQHLHYA